MSSTNRNGAARLAFDAYYTPDNLALACVRTLVTAIEPPRHVVEPSVGGGAFVRAVRECFPSAHVSGYDLNREATGAAICDDFYNTSWMTIAPTVKADLIVGNPPYSEAQDHLEAAFRRVAPHGTVAMLLRLSFASGKNRLPFWEKHRRFLYATYALAERPSFTGGATDSCDYGWFVWRTGRQNPSLFFPGWSWK
jgi:hypothetical protein